jgi:nitrous oxide reductase accessory protein NosL
LAYADAPPNSADVLAPSMFHRAHASGGHADHGHGGRADHGHADHGHAGRDSRATAGDGPTRRSLLAGAAAVAAGGSGALAGCLGGGGDDAPEPVTLTTDDRCDVCGMVIPNHPGPSAEVFYRDRDPAGHPNPARFDSTWEAYQFHFERESEGWTAAAFYVTDYSGVDYTVRRSGGDRLISTHPEAGAFAPAESVTYVAGSEVVGAMGRDLIGFGDRGDAESFRAEYGGDLVAHGEVTPELVARLGRR